MDLNTRTMNYLSWDDFSNIPPIQKRVFDFIPQNGFEWKLIDFDEDELLLFIGQENGFLHL